MKKLSILISAALILHGCAFFRVTPSLDRTAAQQTITLSGNISITSSGPVKIFNRDFLPASFRIDHENTTIYIDPFKIDSVVPADYIFITHAHMDHFSPEDIEKISREETLIIAPQKVAKKLKGYQVKAVKPNEKHDLQQIKFETIEAYNLKENKIAITAHPQKDENVAYIIEINGQRIFHAGDSDVTMGMIAIRNISVAMVPIDGGNLTMTTAEAAEFINTVKPRWVIPMHYSVGAGKANEFRDLVDKNIEMIILQD